MYLFLDWYQLMKLCWFVGAGCQLKQLVVRENSWIDAANDKVFHLGLCYGTSKQVAHETIIPLIFFLQVLCFFFVLFDSDPPFKVTCKMV